MGGTVEDVVDRIREKAAFWAVVVRHFANAQLEVAQWPDLSCASTTRVGLERDDSVASIDEAS